MRLLLSALLALTAMSVGGGITHGEVMCIDPADASPESIATPEAVDFPMTEFPEDGGDLHIFAAASLTDAYNDIAQHLMDEHPNLSITVETAGSQTLVTQLEEGASADVLATANISTMDRAQESGLISGDPVMFTGNRLVIVTPAGNPAGIESIDDLVGDDINLVLANPDVPVGNYSMLAFCDYANVEGGPEGFIDSINNNLVSEEPDVRHVLTKVQLGEADAGVVYASDATGSMLNGVELNVLEFPGSVPTSADYPMAIIEGGNTELANPFISFVMSDEGQDILARYGFQ